MSQHPKQIGQYQIRRLIASGGMGSVYEGLQQNPRRPVAVKVMNSAVATEEAAGRLRYEAQLLARLRHPGIAQIYEAGTYEQDGKQLPFFAMEYIPNPRSVTAYAQEKHLSVRQRLELFAEVCDAVHHGHQRSIVHRDLKPANILVDSAGRVRIIDFGIARATDSDLKRTSVMTEVGQLIGSAAYMSPEQFEADPHDIDTRSDVYALGVVLYELLTGVMPYDAKSASIYEVALMVREERPPLMSSHNRELKGDLETIVDKALRKDRDARYQSAHGLAADIRRYLGGEAIAAQPPSLSYQIRVFTRRNQVVVGLVAAVFLLLVAGVTVVSGLYVEVNEERARAEAESVSAAKARDFLSHSFSAAIPYGYGDDVVVADIYDRAEQKLEEAFPDDPKTEADMCRSLGLGYQHLNRRAQAERHLTRAVSLRKGVLGPRHSKTLESMLDLQHYYGVCGRAPELVALSEEVLEVCEHNYGPAHDSTIDARAELIYALEMDQRLREAGALAKEARDICEEHYGATDSRTIDADQQYAWLLLQNGQLDDAVRVARVGYDQVMDLYSGDAYMVRAARSSLAAAMLATGRVADAKKLYGHRLLPDTMDIERIYQGAFQDGEPGIKILVFWETWCPYSQRAVPKIDQIYREYKAFGVDVLGLTRVRRSSTDEKVTAFLRDNDVSFANVKETGRAWNYFDCRGTPFVVVTHDNEIVWEDVVPSAEAFSDRIIEGLLRKS